MREKRVFKKILAVTAVVLAVLIKLVGITGMVTPGQQFAMVLEKPGGELLPVALEWNCLGWQSMLLFIASLIAGLRGKYINISRLECVVLPNSNLASFLLVVRVQFCTRGKTICC